MEKINFINDKLPALNAENLNQMQANIEKAISNPVVEDIKCKNLFNTKNLHDYNHCNYTIISNNAVIFSSNVITGRVTFDIHDLKPNTDYILSFDRTTSQESGEFLVEVYTTGANLASINSGNQVTFNSGSYTSLVIGFFNRTANDTKIEQTFSNIQLEEGTTATEYTPYKAFGIESGSNENGSWIKYDDGILMQYVTKNIPFTFTSYNKWGVMWESDLTDLGKFPIDFVDTPDTINITNYSSSGGFIESLQNTTNSQIGKMYICRPSDTNGVFNYYLSIIAIGRWK